MKPITSAIILLLSLSPCIAGTFTVTPEEDTDLYQFTTYPTSTAYSLGVNASRNSGHSQKTLLKFPLTASSSTVTPETLVSAKLRLYVLENSANGSGFGGTLQPGDLAIFTQGKSWSIETARWSNVSTSNYLGEIPVTRASTATEAVWVELDATVAVRSWLTGTANDGFLLQAASETATAQLSVNFASMETGFKPQLVIQTLDTPPVLDTTPVLRLIRRAPESTTRKSLTIKGTGSNPIQTVWYRLNRGPLKSAKGTVTWKLTAPLAKGKNRILIYATDADGDRSRPLKLQILRKSALRMQKN